MKVAAIDVNEELFDTCSVYSISEVTPLRLPPLTLNVGVRSETVEPFDGDDGIGGARMTSAST